MAEYNVPDGQAARDGLKRRLRVAGLTDEASARRGELAVLTKTDDVALDTVAKVEVENAAPDEFADPVKRRARFLRDYRRAMTKQREAEEEARRERERRLDQASDAPDWARRLGLS